MFTKSRPRCILGNDRSKLWYNFHTLWNLHHNYIESTLSIYIFKTTFLLIFPYTVIVTKEFQINLKRNFFLYLKLKIIIRLKLHGCLIIHLLNWNAYRDRFQKYKTK